MPENMSTADRRGRRSLRAAALATALLAAWLSFTAAARHPQPPDEKPRNEEAPDQNTPAPADDLLARGLMAQAILAQGNLDRAREIATATVEKFPNNAYALVIMARVHLAFAEFNEAGQALYQAVKLDPRLAVAHLELGRLYEAERRMASAKRHYKTAYDLAPDDAAAMLAWARTVVDPIERLGCSRDT